MRELQSDRLQSTYVAGRWVYRMTGLPIDIPETGGADSQDAEGIKALSSKADNSCPRCEGRGYVRVSYTSRLPVQRQDPATQAWHDVEIAAGTGEATCDVCQGTGRIEHNATDSDATTDTASLPSNGSGSQDSIDTIKHILGHCMHEDDECWWGVTMARLGKEEWDHDVADRRMCDEQDKAILAWHNTQLKATIPEKKTFTEKITAREASKREGYNEAVDDMQAKMNMADSHTQPGDKALDSQVAAPIVLIRSRKLGFRARISHADAAQVIAWLAERPSTKLMKPPKRLAQRSDMSRKSSKTSKNASKEED